MLCLLASVLIGLVSLATTAPSTQASPANAAELKQLVDTLASPDSAAREQATKRLSELGQQARPALIVAIRSNNPEQRSRAASLLMKLPWYLPSDPPDVRRYLSAYGRMDEDGRKLVIQDLYRKLRTVDPLVRLLVEEPTDSVRWQIVSILARQDDEGLWRNIRALDTGADDAPLLRVAAQAWIYRDKNKALELCRRAIDADARNPSSDVVPRRADIPERQLDFCTEQLIDDAMSRKQFAEAAQWLRRQIPREGSEERFSLAKLTALHAYFGPLPGLEDDLRMWALGMQWDKESARKLPTTRQALLSTMNLSADERLISAYFLMEHKLYDPAEQEAKAAAAMPIALDEARLQRDVRASIILGLLYGQQDKDEPAAEALAQAVTIAPRANLGLWRTEADLWSEVHWRRARAADKRGDRTAGDKHVASLQQFTPSATDTAIEIVNWLKSSGRKNDAKVLFDRVYTAAREVVQSTSDPTAFNDLAWLCARCGEHLDEAVELSAKAVDAKPDNAAYLDTAAEANFRVGKRDEATRLETKALEFRPEDEFMQKQLARFKSEKP